MRGCSYRGNSGYSPFQCACPPPNLLFNIRMYIYYRAFCINLPVTASQSQQSSVFVVYLQTKLCAYISFVPMVIFLIISSVSQWFWCALGWCAFLGFKWPPPPLPPSGFIYTPFPHKHFLAIVNATLMIWNISLFHYTFIIIFQG